MLTLPGISAIATVAILSSQAAEPPQQRPELLERLVACGTIADSTARLGCLDAASAALDSAERRGDLVIIDRVQVGETRRQLFGLELPALPHLFRDQASEVEAIETTLQSASQTSDDRWTFRLADGSVWRQVDTDRVRFQNRPGQAVRIRKASLGSFLMTVGGSGGIRVRRQP